MDFLACNSCPARCASSRVAKRPTYTRCQTPFCGNVTVTLLADRPSPFILATRAVASARSECALICSVKRPVSAALSGRLFTAGLGCGVAVGVALGVASGVAVGVASGVAVGVAGIGVAIFTTIVGLGCALGLAAMAPGSPADGGCDLGMRYEAIVGKEETKAQPVAVNKHNKVPNTSTGRCRST